MGIQPTNAGINFQQRVSAWFLVEMMFDMELNTMLNIKNNKTIKEITFESTDKIDDLVLTYVDGKKIFMQMKRSINLSTNKDSEFYSVCKQFVGQFLQSQTDNIAFVLVTSNKASNKIHQVLRRLLDCIRTANTMQIKELNKNEQNILDKLVTIIKEIYSSLANESLSDDLLLQLLNKMYIEVFDIESGESFEKTIKLFLHNKISVNVSLFWKNLISMALQFASNRQTITKDYLYKKLDTYLNKVDEKKISDNSIKTIFEDNKGTFEVGMDYVLAYGNKEINDLFNAKDKTENDKVLYLLELYRFDNNGKRKLIYEEPNLLTLKNKIKLEVIYRSATQKGIERFAESEEFEHKFSNYSIIIIPANANEEGSEFEKIHTNYLKERLNNIKELKCLNCGNAIFQEEAVICEIDSLNFESNLGLIHKECVLPINRVLGLTHNSEVIDYSYLRNFDINLWLKRIRNGQYCFNNLSTLNQPISTLAVETDDNFSLGQYCVRILLEDGTFKYTTRRSKIDRLSKSDAEDYRDQLNDNFKAAKVTNNPICYSSKSFVFGNYEQLVSMIGGAEEYLECTEAEVIKYNDLIAKMHNECVDFYAPLLYLSVEDKPLTIGDLFPLFTNPLELKEYLNNWKKAGIDVADYQVNIIKDDNEFCLKVISFIYDRIRPVIDLKLGKNKEPIQAMFVRTMRELESAQN